MQTKAIVVATDGLFATVQTERKSACDGCHKAEEGGCSVCSLMGGNRTIATKASNPLGAKIGDTVLIESNTSRMLWYAVLVFILPIVFALIGWGISSLITARITIQVVSAFGGFALSLLGVAIYSKKISSYRCDVEITEILTQK